ncbi:MAG TPA: hypothetical protein VLI46_08850, partial [Ramlibacter sp.]|nr:hypothetical protein [Ramlibacter sp.]
MKRRLFITSSSAAIAVALTGCGGGGGGADSAAATGSTANSADAGTAGASGTAQDSPSTSPTQVPEASAPSAGGPFGVGVNVHTGGSSTAQNSQIVALLQARNFRRIRMDYFAGQNQAVPRDFIAKVNAYGGSVEMALQISYQWDHNVYSDLAAVQAKAYNETYAAVDAMKDLVHDYELLNEVQLRPEILAAVPWNSAGASTAPYENQPALANLAAILRGMANAIHDVAARSGAPLRVIMGVIGRDFGLLSFLRNQGVQWDVTGYHVYPRESSANLQNDTWYGAGGPLAQLAAFGKPVTLNEFNPGEIYDPGYENAAGQPLTEQGLRSTAKHMLELYSQTQCKLESVVFYELLDAPSKPAPENRFGLMYNLDTPKVALSLVTALAGG